MLQKEFKLFPRNLNMLPESRLIKSELIIRELALPDDVKLARKSLIRWIALSLGLVLPNESRKRLLDVLEALIYFHVKKESPTTKDIIAKVQEITGKQPYEKAVYYHLLKLKESGLIVRKKGIYSFGDVPGKRLHEIVRDFYVLKMSHIFKNLDEAVMKLEDGYNL